MYMLKYQALFTCNFFYMDTSYDYLTKRKYIIKILSPIALQICYTS